MMWLLRLLHIETTQVLHSARGTPVVHFTGCQYPAAVIQGDVLASWKLLIDQIAQRAEEQPDEELRTRAHLLQERIGAVFDGYNQTCVENRRGGFPEDQAPR